MQHLVDTNSITTFVLYYSKLCKPSVIPYSAANASAFFKRFLLVAFLISVAVVWYVIYNVQPSSSCGPFRDVAEGVYEYIIQIIQDTKLYPLKDASSARSTYPQPLSTRGLISQLCISV